MEVARGSIMLETSQFSVKVALFQLAAHLFFPLSLLFYLPLLGTQAARAFAQSSVFVG